MRETTLTGRERFGMASWVEKASYAAADPGRVAVLVAIAQAEQVAAIDELTLANAAGMLYQRITGQAVETARILAFITDLAANGLLRRDSSGFRWELTPLGTLVSRQWATGAVEPPGTHALETDEIRGWRDQLIAQMDADASLAEEAGIAVEELLAGQGSRLAELRVLNRVLGEEELPGWLRVMAGEMGVIDE
jgi:hypothetical protein